MVTPGSAARRIQRAFRLQRTRAFTNNYGAYRLTRPVVTTRTVNVKLAQGVFNHPWNLSGDLVSLEGRTLIGNPPTFRLTPTTFVGSTSNVKHWTFKFKNGGSVIYHSQSNTMQIVTKGDMTFEPTMRKALKFFSGPKIESYRTINIDGRMYVDRPIDFDKIMNNYRLPVSVGRVEWDPELFSGMFVKWKSPKVTLILSTNGTILIKGTSNMSDGPKVFKQFVDRFGPDIVLKRIRSEAPPVAGEGAYAGRLNARYPPAYSYMPLNRNHPYSVESGYYVRPGPNKKPRYYKIPNNPALIRPKVLKAYANVKVNIPKFVKNALGIVNTARPAPTTGPRPAPNWTATLNGYYVKPGPGKQPFFYKVPAGKDAARKTVIKAYADAGIRIPNSVRNTFGIPANMFNTNIGGMSYRIEGEKINGKHYSRQKREYLIRIARNLNITSVSERNSLETIFRAIKSAMGPSPVRTANEPNVTLNGVAYIFRNNGRVERDGRARAFNTLKKNERMAVAKEFIGSGPRLEHFQTLPTKNWYRTLLSIKKLRAQGAASPRSVSSVNSNWVRNLERELL
jgi:TATA-box binding protein (TBP) (component of TFIID and TFIIIB)